MVTIHYHFMFSAPTQVSENLPWEKSHIQLQYLYRIKCPHQILITWEMWLKMKDQIYPELTGKIIFPKAEVTLV